MKTHRITITIALVFSVLILQAQKTESDLKHWPKGSSPTEVGKRIVVKFLNTPHSRYGNTHPVVPPTQITYPDVCAWLGGLWFAKVTNDKPMLNQLETRFNPLFESQKNLLPKPNHVDNNVFGSLAFELYLQTKEKKYLDLGLTYADAQWALKTAGSTKKYMEQLRVKGGWHLLPLSIRTMN